MNEHKPSLPNELEAKADRAFPVSIITGIVMAIAAIAFVFNSESPANFTLAALYNAYSATFSFGVMGLAALVSAWLARRNQADLGISLIIGIIYIVMISAVLFQVSGIGFVMAAMTIVLTAGIATVTLTKKYQTWAIGSAIAVAVLILLLDLIRPFNPPDVGDSTFSWIIGGALIVVYGFFILRNFRTYTLSTKLTAITVAMVVITLAGVTFIASRTIQSSVTQQIGEAFELEAEAISIEITSFLVGKIGQIQAIALVDAIKDAVIEKNASYSGTPAEIQSQIDALDAQWRAAADDDPLIRRTISPDEAVNPIASQLVDFAEAFEDQAEIFVTDRHGATIAATNRLSDYYQADEEWWQKAWNDGQGAVFVSNPEFDESAGILAVLVAVPIVDEDNGEVIGIVRSTLAIDEMFDLLEDVKIGETGHALLFDSSGGVLYDPGTEGADGTAADLPLELRQAFAQEDAHFEVAPDQHGGQSIFGHAPFAAESGEREADAPESQAVGAITKLGWAVVIQQEVAEAFIAAEQTVQNILIASLVAIGLISLVMIFVGRGRHWAISRPRHRRRRNRRR